MSKRTRFKLSIFSISLVGLLLLLSGCMSGLEVQKHLLWLNQRIKELEKQGVKRCAPYPYAHGKAEYEFAQLELKQGQHIYAERHMYKARAWIKIADREMEVWRKRKELWRCLGKPKPRKPKPKPKPRPKPRPRPKPIDPCAKDSDRDRIADCRDLCPLRPEDYQGFEDSDGCPDGDRDSDGDGFRDWQDKCPFEPEDRNNFQDDDGCPDSDLDTDTDKVPDFRDKCPLKFGRQADGCPKKYTLVVVTKKKIELKQKVFFATARAIIRRRSYPLLRQVAQVLKDHPKISVCIEGHTDNRGGFRYNLRLSQRRAEAVRRFLMREGISADRMRSRGYSYAFPIDTNRTREGRANNRRVEINIVEPTKPCPKDPEWEKLMQQRRMGRRRR